MKIIILCIFIIQAINFATSQASQPAKLKIVYTQYGEVRGIQKQTILGRGYFSFQSIPYMKAPVGKLRFRDPQPPVKWNTPLDATQEPPGYPAYDSIAQQLVGQENAAVINVYTPFIKPASLLPVIVWIHGGYFQEGSSKTELYGPDFLLQKEVVVVTFNYRLGVFGFLSLKDPKLNIPGNAGLKDQNFALKWVQRNIRNFGGDPNRVTLVGESAGAVSVHLHMMSDQSKNLFKRAIVFSGAAINFWAIPPIPNFAQRLAQVMGLATTNETQILEFLESANAFQIVAAKFAVPTDVEKYSLTADVPIGPVVEPAWSKTPFLNKDPVVAARTAWSNDIDAIFGSNSFEGLFLALKEYLENITAVINTFNDNPAYFAPLSLLKMLPSDPQARVYGERIKNLYFDASTGFTNDTLLQFYKFGSDYAFIHGNYRSVQSRLTYGKGKSYMSRFGGDTQQNFFKLYVARKPNVPGATHADDVSYYFKSKFTPSIGIGSFEFKLVKTMVDLITSFAVQGTPTESSGLVWADVKKGDTIPNVFNINNNGTSMIPLPEYNNIKVFNEIYLEAKVPLI